MDESKRPQHRVFTNGVEVENRPFTDKEWAEWNAQDVTPVVAELPSDALTDLTEIEVLLSDPKATIEDVKQAVITIAKALRR